MTPLRDAVDEYIALRRGLGFKLRDMATGLPEFAAFLEQHAASSITTALAVAWAMQPVDHQPSDWAKRLGFVRVFARHWSATDPRTEIPTAGLLPFRAKRRQRCQLHHLAGRGRAGSRPDRFVARGQCTWKIKGCHGTASRMTCGRAVPVQPISAGAGAKRRTLIRPSFLRACARS
jgi:hypothetical protein